MVLVGNNTPVPETEITVDLADVIQGIPGQYLKADRSGEEKQEFKFKISDLLPSLSLGKASLPLSRIAALAPELFSEDRPGEDVEIHLPLKKIVEQIDVFPLRPDQMEEQYPSPNEEHENLVVEKRAAPASAPVAQAIEEETAEVPPQPPVAEQEKTVEQPTTEEVEALPPIPAIHEENVSYSLVALLPNLPKSWLIGELKQVDHTARIIVPFHLIESQLAGGKVELAFHDFFKSLPENLRTSFSDGNDEGKTARIQIPLHEVFLNLPGVEALPPMPKPDTIAAEDSAPVLESGEPEPVSDSPVISGGDVAEKTEEHPPARENKDLQTAPAEQPAERVSAEAGARQITDTAEVKPADAPPAQNGPASVIAADVVAEEKPVESKEPEIPPAPPALEVAEKPEPPGVQCQPVPQASQPEAGATTQPAGKTAEETPAALAPETPGPENSVHAQPVSGESAGIPELAPAPFTPPKIDLQRFTPPPIIARQVAAPSLETAPPESESEKVLDFKGTSTAFNTPTLKDLLTNGGKLDSGRVARHIAQLPGVSAAALTIETGTETAGVIPQSFNAHDIGNAAATLLQSLEAQSPQACARNITLHHDSFSSTWFKQGVILLGVLHPQRALEAALHDQLALVMDEIARLR